MTRALAAAILLLTCTLMLSACSRSQNTSGQAGGATASRDTTANADIPKDIDRTPRQVRLRMRFTPGDEFGFAIRSTERVNLLRDTSMDRSVQSTTYRYKFRVLDTLADGTGTLQVTCQEVTFHGDYSSNGQKRVMDYDSKAKNDAGKDRMFAQYNAALNTPFKITVTPEGRIASVSDIDRVLQRLMGADYNTTKFETKKQLAANLSDDLLKGQLQMVFQKLEDRVMGVDSSWTITQPQKMGYLMYENRALYTLKGFTHESDGERAHIAIRLTSKFTGNRKMDTGQGMATLDAFDVTGEGATDFDLTHGRPAHRTSRQKLHVKFFIEPPAELKQAAPDQAKDFWMTQDATIEHVIERY